MNLLVSIIECVNFIALLMACILLVYGWKNAWRRDVKLLLAGLLGTLLFNSLSNFLEFSRITKALSQFEDFVIVLTPILFAFFLYSFLQQIAKRDLQESLQRNEALLQAIPDMIFILTRDGRYVDFKAKQKEDLAIPASEIIGKNIRDAGFSGDSLKEIFNGIEKAIDTGTPQIIEYELETPGGVKHSEARIAALDENKVLLIVRDITKHIQTEEALVKERNLLRTLIDNLPDLIYVKDTKSRFITCNTAVAHLMGAATTDELIGKRDFDFYPEEIAEKFYTDEQETIRSGQAILQRIEPVVDPEGHNRWLSTTKVPLKDSGGKIVGIMGIGRDITEQRHLEEQLLQSQKLEAVARLTGGVAHDFNNMLTAIIGYSDYLLMSYKQDDSLCSMIHEIKKAGERAASLTQQLLAFSRRQVLKPKVMNINTSISEMEKLLHRLIGEDIKIVTFTEPELKNVKADPIQIEQIIMNLALNARDAMPNGGNLTIETANVYLDENYAIHHVSVQPGPYVMLAISDNGIGMDEETQNHIFEPFYTTKEKGKGTGLGLSTVYGIVKQSNGNIWVYSEPGKGTTFKIYLPQVPEEAEQKKIRKVPAQVLQGTETILIAEDDDIVRGLISSVLKSYGYTVLEAKNGKEALSLIEKPPARPIDLLITDVVMPGMSGRMLVDKITQHHSDMKILYISGYTDNTIIHHGVLDEGVPFLQKPFTPHVLASKIREILEGK